MARRLRFSTYQPDTTDEPIEVELNGTSVFYFKPTMIGLNLLDHLENIDSQSNSVAARAIKGLLREALVEDPAEFPDVDPPIPEDNVDAFFAYLRDRNNHIDLPKLQEIADQVIGEIAGGRPTESSQELDSGSATNGSGSTVKRSAKAATSKR